MRFLSIAAFAGLIATTSVAARTSDTSDANLEARTWACNKGQERNRWGMCVDCPEGKYSPYGTSCDTCPTGSSCGSRESSCVCQPGYYLQSYGGRTSGAACNACPSGYVSGAGASSCNKCPANTYANGSQCKPCENGYVSDAGSASCTPKCGPGYYLNNGSCKKCGPGSYSPGGAASCTTCPTGTFCNSEGASSCNNCPAGQTSGPGAKDCVPFNCPAGKYKQNGACADCPAGSYSGPNASSCSQCPANTFSTGGSSSCTSCPRGSSCLPGSSQCSSGCKAGQFSNNGKCETCPAGWYSQAGATSCSDCPDDTYSSAGASSCTKCPTGKGCGGRSTTINQCIDKCPDGQVYQNGRCSSCPAGKYSNNNQCSECPPGAVSNPGSNSCTQCPPGKIPNENGKTCGECPANTYSNGDNCTPCPAGSTSPKGSSSCGPQPSKRAVPFFSTIPSCYGPGMQLCDVPGSGGSECLNTFTTLDSCGGCVAPYGELDTTGKYTGRDCSAIPHVDTVECVNGGCEIKSCQSGYEPSGDSCVEKAAYVGKNQTAHGARAKRSLLGSRHDSF